ncbi:MAG: hypothetical protein IJV63_03105 [Bacteroidales bacterium]|nr:hypothetical protein [Bacteroidales bacterium]
MKQDNKEKYLTPESEEFELKLEGVIAASETVNGIPGPDDIPGIGF